MVWIYGAFFALAVAKWSGWDKMNDISWWWILLPLLAVILWFEAFERMLGFDSARKLKDAEFEKAKRDRIRGQLKKPKSNVRR